MHSNYWVTIPVSEIATWWFDSYRTVSGEFWKLSDESGNLRWNVLEPLPWEPVGTNAESLNDLKSMFK